MDQLQKEIIEGVQIAVEEAERFLNGMTEMVDAFFEFTEEIADQVQNTIVNDLDQCIQELTEPFFFDTYWDLEGFMGDIDPGFPYQVEASSHKNPACMGCRNYHGQVYSGNLLVCGMHPFGWEGEGCPDWESY